MKTILKLSLFAVVALSLACATPTNTNTTTNTNTNAAPKAAAPTAAALMTTEKQAWEAYNKKDGKFFETFLADNFVGFSDKGERPSRAEVLKMIAENKCEMKSFTLSDEHLTPVGADAAVLTYKAVSDGTCEGQKAPSPMTVATVFVRSGDSWKAAYHNEVPLIEPKADASTNKNATSSVEGEKKEAVTSNTATKKEMPAAPAPAANSNANAASNTNAAAPAGADALTDALMAVEKKGWEAWMKQDAKAQEAVTGKDLTFVDPMGKVTKGQADVVKMWSDGSCKVSKIDVSDGKGAMITKDAAILTFKGTADGTCGDNKVEPIWGTTVYLKEGETWRAIYIFETPSRS